MIIAEMPKNEEDRLASLYLLQVLDTAAEEEFDVLTKVASLICGTSIALISLIDSKRQWFKANIGLPGVPETSRDIAFCSHAILEDHLLEVQDALQDPRFTNNPLVIGSSNIRFYAGVPIILNDGNRIGTLCVLDQTPKVLNEGQKELLRTLARAVAKALEGRRAINNLENEARARIETESRFRTLSESSPHGVFYANTQGVCTYTNQQWQSIYGLSLAQSISYDWMTAVYSEDKESVYAEWQKMNALGKEFVMDFRLVDSENYLKYVYTKARPIFNNDKNIIGYVGSIEDITERVQTRAILQKTERLLDRTNRLAGMGGWEFDLTQKVIYWSDETCRIHGVSSGFMPNLEEAIQFYTPDSRAAIMKAVEISTQTGESWDLELTINNAKGELLWVRAVGTAEMQNGKAIRLIGAFQDISEIVKKRNKDKDAKDRMDLATDSGGIGIWDLDLVNDILYWDEWMFRLYGTAYVDHELNFAFFEKRIYPEDYISVKEKFQIAIDNKSILDAEFRVVWDDLSIHYLKVSAKIHYDQKGNAIRVVGANWDITPERTLSRQLKEHHELLRITLRSIGDAVITTDAQCNVVWLNPVAEKMTGWLTIEAINRPIGQIFHIVNEETRAPAENPIPICIATNETTGIANNTLLISRDGTEYEIKDSAAPILDDNGNLLGAVLVFHDVTEQKKLSDEMSYRASHDALTGLVNRPEFENRLEKLLKLTHSNHGHNALLLIDLDQFKLLNDACGHAVGDQLLQEVAKLFSATLRSHDTVARLGSDEFAVILEHCPLDKALKVATQIRDRLEDYRFVHDGRRYRIGASIGLVPVDDRWVSTALIMQAADASCYAAKQSGGNRVHQWFDADLTMRHIHEEMQWTTRIEHAIDENRFVLFAQKIHPINATSVGVHAEVLLRMLDTDGSIIPPGIFLPAAEKYHLASRIDRWVLRNSIDWISQLKHPEHIHNLSINLSGQSVGDRAFHRWASELLSQVDPNICRRLCLEITETSAITNMDDAVLFIEQMREIGMRVALDDFGAGASSFGYLKSMPVDYLKIDGQFVRDIITDPLDAAAVRCFIDVAKVVGIKTVAEFVDNDDVLKRLTDMGVHYAQGYLLHKPAPIDELITVEAELEIDRQ